MLQSESGLLFDYFNDKIFVTKANEDAMRIYWPNDLEEYTFASHTSVINPSFLLQIFLDNGIISEDQLKDE